jgi:hypothetical protein
MTSRDAVAALVALSSLVLSAEVMMPLALAVTSGSLSAETVPVAMSEPSQTMEST